MRLFLHQLLHQFVHSSSHCNTASAMIERNDEAQELVACANTTLVPDAQAYYMHFLNIDIEKASLFGGKLLGNVAA